MGRMVHWHVIQERLELCERWYGDRLVLGDTCVHRESECGCGWDAVSVSVKVKVNLNLRCTWQAGIGHDCSGKPRRASGGSCYREAR